MSFEPSNWLVNIAENPDNDDDEDDIVARVRRRVRRQRADPNANNNQTIQTTSAQPLIGEHDRNVSERESQADDVIILSQPPLPPRASPSTLIPNVISDSNLNQDKRGEKREREIDGDLLLEELAGLPLKSLKRTAVVDLIPLDSFSYQNNLDDVDIGSERVSDNIDGQIEGVKSLPSIQSEKNLNENPSDTDRLNDLPDINNDVPRLPKETEKKVKDKEKVPPLRRGLSEETQPLAHLPALLRDRGIVSNSPNQIIENNSRKEFPNDGLKEKDQDDEKADDESQPFVDLRALPSVGRVLENVFSIFVLVHSINI